MTKEKPTPPADAETFYQNLVENASMGVVTIDTNSQVIYSNMVIEDILGHKPDKLVGRSLTKIIPDRLAEDHRRALEAYLHSGEPSIDWNGIEVPAEHRDGHEVDVEINFHEHEYDGNRVFTGFISDISTRKEQKRELRRQNKRLDEFASVVSHDLRNPLNVAKGRIALAQEEYDSDDLDTAARNIERSFELIEDMLTLAREGQRASEMQPVDLASLIETCWEDFETANATVAVDLDQTIQADRSRLRQLLENLIRNAVEHGGDDVVVRVGALPEGFYVEDDGPGIPEDERESVFEPGYSNSPDGTGFGLAIVKRIAEAHGWEVHVTEGADGGARFEFTDIEVVAE